MWKEFTFISTPKNVEIFKNTLVPKTRELFQSVKNMHFFTYPVVDEKMLGYRLRVRIESDPKTIKEFEEWFEKELKFVDPLTLYNKGPYPPKTEVYRYGGFKKWKIGRAHV